MHVCIVFAMIQNTQEIKENTFEWDKTGQNMQIFEEVLFFKLSTTSKQKSKQLIHLAYNVS